MAQLSEPNKEGSHREELENKTIEYSCGCIYIFDNQIILKRICEEHETQLITYNG
jgi:hypothetical protein